MIIKSKIFKSYISLIVLLILGTLTTESVIANSAMPTPLEWLKQKESRYNKKTNTEHIKITTTIEQDINDLSDETKKKNAVQRLIARGNKIIPQMIAMIENDEQPYKVRAHGVILVYKVAELTDVSAIIKATEVIEPQSKLQERVPKYYPYYTAIKTLKKFEQTDEILNFINKQLDNKHREDHIQAYSLLYFVERPNKVAAKWVKQYGVPSAKIEVRYAAYYLGGMLGMKSVKKGIIEILKSPPDNSRKYLKEQSALLKGLAELTTLDEFNAIIKNTGTRAYDEKTQHYVLFRLGNKEQRANAFNMILRGSKKEIEKAISILINKNDAQTLAIHWQVGNPFVKSYLLKSGLAIKVKNKKASFIKAEDVKQKVNLFPTPESLAKAVIMSFNKNSKDKFIKIAKINENFEVIEKINLEKIHDSWADVYKKGASAGLNWAQARYVSSKYMILVDKKRLQMTDINVLLEQNDKYYDLSLQGNVFFEGDWMMIFPLLFYGETGENREAMAWYDYLVKQGGAMTKEAVKFKVYMNKIRKN